MPGLNQNKGTGITVFGFQCSWFQPTVILILVTYIYCVYVGLNLIPALQNINSQNMMNDEGTGFISGTPSLSSFISDPHATKMTFTEFVVCTLGFHVLLIMFAISLVKAIVTPPGSVPVDKQSDRKKWDDGLFDISPDDDQRIEDITLDYTTDLTDPEIQSFIRGMILVERKKESHAVAGHGGLKRHCKTCQIFKPDRTHHCKVCGHCVLRMDHRQFSHTPPRREQRAKRVRIEAPLVVLVSDVGCLCCFRSLYLPLTDCPWVANCIGFRNYKYFLLTLFYVILLSFWILATMLERFRQVFQPVLNRSNFWYMDLPVAIAYGLVALVFIGLVVFFGQHISMTLGALTSIERSEKRNSQNKEISHRFNIAHIKFDQGPYQNFLHVMGPPSIETIDNKQRARDYSHASDRLVRRSSLRVVFLLLLF